MRHSKMLLTLHLVMLCTFANAKNLGYRPDLLSETNFYAGGNYVRGLTQEFRVEAFAGAYIVGLNVEGGYINRYDQESLKAERTRIFLYSSAILQ